jgi:hypothetical protein
LTTPDRKVLASEIDDLLGAGINLDQVMILESEGFSGQTIADCSRLLKSIKRSAMANAERFRKRDSCFLGLPNFELAAHRDHEVKKNSAIMLQYLF